MSSEPYHSADTAAAVKLLYRRLAAGMFSDMVIPGSFQGLRVPLVRSYA